MLPVSFRKGLAVLLWQVILNHLAFYYDKAWIIVAAARFPAPIALIAVEGPRGATSPPAYTPVSEVSPFSLITI